MTELRDEDDGIGGEMAGDEMIEGEMIGGEMAGDEMLGDEMIDDEMIGLDFLELNKRNRSFMVSQYFGFEMGAYFDFVCHGIAGGDDGLVCHEIGGGDIEGGDDVECGDGACSEVLHVVRIHERGVGDVGGDVESFL